MTVRPQWLKSGPQCGSLSSVTFSFGQKCSWDIGALGTLIMPYKSFSCHATSQGYVSHQWFILIGPGAYVKGIKSTESISLPLPLGLAWSMTFSLKDCDLANGWETLWARERDRCHLVAWQQCVGNHQTLKRQTVMGLTKGFGCVF